MVSYTDVMTILLILFVAIAAKAVQEPRPSGAGLQSAARSQAALMTAFESRGIHPNLETRGLVIGLPQTVLYASGDDEINPAALPLIGQIAAVLRGVPNKVTLVGHADATPIHNGRFSNNWELSAARSLRLLELLTSRYGIPESRLAISSYGAYSPRTSNDTPEGRAENRRVEILILDDPSAG